jgi:D-sedoheptulose 7-phosphate isomerase
MGSDGEDEQGDNWAGAYLARSAEAAAALARDRVARDVLARMAAEIREAFRAGRKLLVAGNGGSAGDAQHIAGEFVVRLLYDRAPLPAIALTVDGSVLTAAGNDYGFEHVFARQVRALGRPGDVLLAISTSGRSANLLRALEAAGEIGMARLGFAGRAGGQMARFCDLVFRAPADETPIVQQLHITAAHVLCALCERSLFPRME